MRLLDGTNAEVESIIAEHLEEPVKVYNFEVEDWHTYYVAGAGVLVHNAHTTCGPSGTGSMVPVPDVVEAQNGLRYKSNPKHTVGQIGNRHDAGIEPKNSLDLFENSVVSTSPKYANQRFSYDESSKTLHRFFSDNSDIWHWSGSTNQGANSLTSKQVPIDIIRLFDLPRKGW